MLRLRLNPSEDEVKQLVLTAVGTLDETLLRYPDYFVREIKRHWQRKGERRTLRRRQAAQAAHELASMLAAEPSMSRAAALRTLAPRYGYNDSLQSIEAFDRRLRRNRDWRR
jgi:hypothetical protein